MDGSQFKVNHIYRIRYYLFIEYAIIYFVDTCCYYIQINKLFMSYQYILLMINAVERGHMIGTLLYAGLEPPIKIARSAPVPPEQGGFDLCLSLPLKLKPKNK